VHEVILQRARSMRLGPTSAEDVLWERLRNRRLNGWKFRRQFAWESFILDFYCAEAKLVVEVDGPIHLQKKRYDRERTIWLEVSGFEVVRFTNARVFGQIEEVLSEIEKQCVARVSPRPGTPGRGAGGEG
jgi:very-short-patch-repair endonuclease